MNGAVAGVRHPLIVMSHGTGGMALNCYDTAMALAEAGFMVAAVTHTGTTTRISRTRSHGATSWIGRDRSVGSSTTWSARGRGSGRSIRNYWPVRPLGRWGYSADCCRRCCRHGPPGRRVLPDSDRRLGCRQAQQRGTVSDGGGSIRSSQRRGRPSEGDCRGGAGAGDCVPAGGPGGGQGSGATLGRRAGRYRNRCEIGVPVLPALPISTWCGTAGISVFCRHAARSFSGPHRRSARTRPGSTGSLSCADSTSR